jgi:ClpP class serine protease
VDPLSLLWIFLILIALQPALQRQILMAKRRGALGRLSAQREATVITLIHRQETISFLGVPLVRHIDIDDAESVLRAIRETPPGRPIEIILHTPGGLVLAASQIALALADHDGPITAVVPHYAMSGGTVIALAADEIVLDQHAALGPIDPQLGQWPAVSILAAIEAPGIRKDETLMLGDIARKALRQVETLAIGLLERNTSPERAKDVARLLAGGAWTHDHPLMPRDLELLGLPIKVGVPEEERMLLDLYPQPRGRQAAVEYFPGRPGPPGLPPGRERPRPKPRRARPADTSAQSPS